MKTLILAAIRCSLMFTAVTASLFCDRPAQAYTVRLKEMMGNVVANGSGAINLTGLTFESSSVNRGVIIPNGGVIQTGPTVFTQVDNYTGFSGPTNFGSGGGVLASTGTGDAVGIRNDNFFGLSVPTNYVSNNPLSDSATWNNATFASLGVTPGVYTWRWGTNGANQFFRLVIGPNTVPDGGSTVSLLGFALLGLAALRRKFSC
jgi:hypothetical protein